MFIMLFTGVRLSGIPACSSCHLQPRVTESDDSSQNKEEAAEENVM